MAVNPLSPLSAPTPGRVTEGPAPRSRPSDSDSAPPSPAPSPVEAPVGDPTLWDLLTPEERVVLERHAGLGSLTYRPNGRPGSELPVPTGRRIDIRG